MFRTTIFSLCALTLSAPAVAQCAQHSATPSVVTRVSTDDRPTIAGIATVNENFETLATALRAAELVETLDGAGPFTVFAPTDAAFAKLNQSALRNTLRNKERLTQVLTYHVVPGRITAAELATRRTLTTVSGQRLAVATDGAIRLNDASVINADVEAGNGIIHVVDAVLIPAKKSIAQTAADASFDTLVSALTEAGLVDIFASNETVSTVFAPTDKAFEALGQETIDALLLPSNREILVRVLKYHAVPGRVYSEAVAAGLVPTTLAGERIDISTDGEGIRVGGARVVKADIDATNGVIHAINTVLIPPGLERTLSSLLEAPPSTGFAAGDAIATAIARGAPLFNDGNEEACRAVYATTATNLLAFDAYGLRESERKLLEDAIAEQRVDDARVGAWALRNAFNAILQGRAREASGERH